TVLFIDQRAAGKSVKPRLLIVQTTNWPEDAVRRWKSLTRPRAEPVSIPESSQGGWQARIQWDAIYTQVQPWLSLIAAFADDAILPPSADEIRSNLPDSVISIHTDFSGLRVQHSGPIPLGVFYVPGVVAASIT